MSKSCFQIVCVCAFVLSMSLLAGCTSIDRHVFESSPTRPTTVTVVDQLTEEPLWSLDIPVGDALVLKVHTGGDGSAAKTMKWATYQASAMAAGNRYMFASAKSSDSVDLGIKVRIDVSYRPVGEEPAVATAPIPNFEVEEPATQPAEAATEIEEVVEEVVEDAVEGTEAVVDDAEAVVEDVVTETQGVAAEQEPAVAETQPSK